MEPFIGIIMPVAFNFAPRYWSTCAGQTMQISTNQALFSLLGTTFGGDGRTTFMLPNLQGRVPVGAGANGVSLGQKGGEEGVTLNGSQMPQHNHAVSASSAAADTPFSRGATLATNPMYKSLAGGALAMDGSALTTTGGSQPHENRSPYLAVNWIIALQGIFPSFS